MSSPLALPRQERRAFSLASRRIWVPFGLGLVALTGAASLTCLATDSRAREPRAPRDWAEVSSKEMPTTVVTTGTVRLKTGAQVRVGAELSGVVKRLLVAVGSRVAKGDLIATIDARAVEARLAQARAQMEIDRLSLEKAKADSLRNEGLLAEGLIPTREAQDTRWAREEAEARLEKSASDLAAVEVDLRHAEIRAPISGRVASVSTQEGETVASSFSTPTFVTIIDDHDLELVALVDETDIADVKAGEKLNFTTEAYPAREIPGVVMRVNPAAAIIAGVVNFEAVATIGGGGDFLRPDMTANVSIETARRRVLVVPDSAVRRGNEGTFLILEDGGGGRERPVAVGREDGGFTEVKSGVREGQRVLLGEAPPGAARG